LAAQEPSLRDVLSRAALYVERFHKEVSGIVAEETYVQRIVAASANNRFFRQPAVREIHLRSDFLLVRPADGGGGYVEFRDVFAVDGKPVRDREERLTRLFLDGSASAQGQMRQIIQESSRYNLGRVVRTINTPTLPLQFLEAVNQSRFRFQRGAQEEPSLVSARSSDATPSFRAATEVWVLDFEETAPLTVVRTPDGANLPSRGRFWIDPIDGAVRMSELIVVDPNVRATIDVSFRLEPIVGLWVPSEMHERYQATRDVIEGRATYSRFRRFQVEVAEDIPATPKP